MPAAAKCRQGYHAPGPNLATVEASHQSRELLAYMLHRKVPIFVGSSEGVRRSKPACGVWHFSTRPWEHHDIPQMGWSSSRQLRGLPGLLCCSSIATLQDTNHG